MDDILRNFMRGLWTTHPRKGPDDGMLKGDDHEFHEPSRGVFDGGIFDGMNQSIGGMFGDMDSVFKEMDSAFREMDEVLNHMQHFQIRDKESNDHHPWSNFPDAPPQSDSLRNSMLKEPDSEGDTGHTQAPVTPWHQGPHITIMRPIPGRNEGLEQLSDMDDAKQLVPQSPRVFTWNMSKSSSFQRSCHNGTCEERVTQRDGTGQEVTTVTRSRGDQKHVVTTTRDLRTGEQNVTEQFINVDDKNNFLPAASPSQLPSSYPPLDSQAPGLFKKLFGSIFKDK